MMIKAEWLDTTQKDALKEVYQIRKKVFVDELDFPPEMVCDSLDKQAGQLLLSDGDLPVACGRIIFDGDEYVLGFIAVLPEHRKHSYGDFVVRMLIRRAYEHGGNEQLVQARLQAKSFYEKLGFACKGDIYFKYGTEHIDMIHIGDVSGNCN